MPKSVCDCDNRSKAYSDNASSCSSDAWTDDNFHICHRKRSPKNHSSNKCRKCSDVVKKQNEPKPCQHPCQNPFQNPCQDADKKAKNGNYIFITIN